MPASGSAVACGTTKVAAGKDQSNPECACWPIVFTDASLNIFRNKLMKIIVQLWLEIRKNISLHQEN